MRKVFVLWLFATLLPLTGAAASASLSIESFSIKAGETKEMIIDLSNPSDEITLVQFDLRLPSGLSVKEADGEYDIDIAGRTTWKDHSLEANKLSDGSIRFLLYSSKQKALTGTSGAIIKVTLIANSSLSGGDIKLENILLTTTDQKEITPETYTYKVPVQNTITITAKSYSREYGDTNPTFEYSVSGGTLTGTPKLTCTATKNSDVGTYTIKVDKGTVQGDVRLVDGKLTVTQAPLTVSVGDYSRKEGEDNPTFKLSYSGWKNGDTESVLTKKPTASCSATKSSPAGTYTITVSGGEAKNYKLNHKNGTLTVTPKDPVPDKRVVITADDVTIAKGGTADLVVRMDYDTKEKVSGWNFSLYLPDGIALNTDGTSASQLKKCCTVSSETHDEDIEPQSFLSVRAKSDGGYLLVWIDDDDQTPLISTHGKLVTIKLKATTEVNGVGYIKGIGLTNAASQSLDNGNIADVSFNIHSSGMVKNQQTLSLTEIPSQTYGSTYTLPTKTDQGLSLTWKVKDASIASISGSTLKTLNVGTTTVTATQSGNDSYASFSKDYSLTVTQASLNVSVGDYSRKEGEDNPAFKISYSGWKNGDTESVLTTKPTASCSATKNSPAGTYTITVSGGSAKNYKLNYKNGTLTVTKKDVKTYSVRTSNDGYATFYDSQDNYSLPSGLIAQVVTGISGGKLSYKTLTGSVVPKGTAVMLKGSGERTYTLTSTTESASFSGTNLLRGSDNATTTTGDGYHYKLCYGSSGSSLSNVFGWYWGASNGGAFRIDGHKAWLVLPKSGTRAEWFSADGDVSEISNPLEQLDGNHNGGDCYDLMGRRVSQPTRKGLYIRNGKKVVNK